jgi:peptidoglycan/xylan/chitin deacetylase (PgdA/CDA1 family)
LWAGFYLRGKYVAPILMYHCVIPNADPANRMAVTDKAFARQMRFLREHHYNVLPLAELADLIRKKEKIPPRSIAVTFDDGYKDNYAYAFPVLKKYRIPATIFIIINDVGLPHKLNWQEIKEMQDSGLVAFGSHTLGPEPLVNIVSAAELRRQVFESKRILEERLGREVGIFSYPEGRFNYGIRKLVIEAGYKTAVATNPGRDYPDDDSFALKRMRITASADNLFVFWLEASGYYSFLREWKYQYK